MNGMKMRRGDGPRAALVALGLVVVGLTATPADAATMRNGRAQARALVQARAYARRQSQIEAYFERALATRQMHIVLTPDINMRLTNGLLPDSGVVQYLQWRRSLAPARFDHYHPRMGPLLALDQQTRSRIPRTPTVDAQVIQGPVPPPVGPRVPEPSSILVGLAMVGAGAWWRRRRG